MQSSAILFECQALPATVLVKAPTSAQKPPTEANANPVVPVAESVVEPEPIVATPKALQPEAVLLPAPKIELAEPQPETVKVLLAGAPIKQSNCDNSILGKLSIPLTDINR